MSCFGLLEFVGHNRTAIEPVSSYKNPLKLTQAIAFPQHRNLQRLVNAKA
jgi:hypothetical protein